jgi:hypothetical protein
MVSYFYFYRLKTRFFKTYLLCCYYNAVFMVYRTRNHFKKLLKQHVFAKFTFIYKKPCLKDLGFTVESKQNS